MKIEGNDFLVTGGAGFIGSHVVEELLKWKPRRIIILDNLIRGKVENIPNDPSIRFIRGDILNEQLVRGLVQVVDGVFHLAALWLLECQTKQPEAFAANVMGTQIINEAIKLGKKGTKLVYSSSASVYGNALEIPMTEEHPLGNRNFYGATKIASEQLIIGSGIPHTILRYMNVYGPRQPMDGAYSGVIPITLDRLKRISRPVIEGDGSATFDFIHVKDVAWANVLAMMSGFEDGVFNISTGVGTTIKDLVEMLIAYSPHKENQIVYKEERKGDRFVTKRIGSTELAYKKLGFRAKISLEEGLKDLCKDYFK